MQSVTLPYSRNQIHPLKGDYMNWHIYASIYLNSKTKEKSQ
ncbi:MAG TPA: hypothetical protein PLF21_03315 [Exilispira sp.]|nr:hypothetical protein [Exilispira sp.]